MKMNSVVAHRKYNDKGEILRAYFHTFINSIFSVVVCNSRELKTKGKRGQGRERSLYKKLVNVNQLYTNNI